MKISNWRRAVAYWAVILLGVLVVAGSAMAQSVRGAISGNIADPTGAVIPNATIVAKNVQTGATLNTVSSSVGSYRFPSVPLGTYNITAKAAGFAQSTYTGALVQIQSTTTVNITLQPGSAAQTVTVNASALTVETQTSDVGGVISHQQIIQLPLALGGVGGLRSPEAFVFLLPGSVGPGTANNTDNGVFLAKTAGGQEYGNEVILDGASQQRSENGSSFDEEAPSVEALQEFKVTNAFPEAQYGRTTGGIENFVTKSGTNEFHGTAYELFKNEDLDANTWFNNGNRATTCVGVDDTPECRATFARNQDKKNDYGVAFGGPVVIPHLYNGKDKLFFFFSWEQFRWTPTGTTVSTVPTLAERGGDFSALIINNPQGKNPCDGTTIYQGQIFDPATQTVKNGIPCRTAFSGNKIDPSRFSNFGNNILQYYPLPTNDKQFNNFNYTSTDPMVNTAETIRVDSNLNEKNKVWASYSARDNSRISGGFRNFPDPVDPGTWSQDFMTHFGRFGWDYSITPTLLNHLNFGVNRSNSKNYAVSISYNKDWTSELGVSNGAPSKNFPRIAVGSNFTNLGSTNSGDLIDNGFLLDDDLNWQHGRSNYKIGVDARFQQFSPAPGPVNTLNFSSNQTAVDTQAGPKGKTGNGFASELLGEMSGANFGFGLMQRLPRWTWNYYAVFFQDDVKVSDTLTLNLGLRWSLDMPRREAHGQTSNFSPTAIDPEYGVPGALIFATTCKSCQVPWASAYYKDFAPRIGFAWAPANVSGKLAFRGGFGIMYGPLQYADDGRNMIQGYKTAPSFPSLDGFTSSFQIDDGIPAYSQPPDFDPGFYNGNTVAEYIEPQFGKPAAIYQWGLQMQQQIAQSTIFTLGYLGNKSQNLRSNLQDINSLPEKYFSLGDGLTQLVSTNTLGVTAPFAGFSTLWGKNVQVQQALRPFSQYSSISNNCCLQNVGMSSYNAMLVSLKRRFENGLQAQVSYTWSKTITNADSLLPNGGFAEVGVQNVFNLHREKAISVQDIPSNFVVSWLYQLPFGKNQRFLTHGIASYVAGGWRIGGVQRYMSGQPISFLGASGIPGYGGTMRFSRYGKNPIESPAARSGKINPFFIPSYGADPAINSMFNLPTDRAEAINEPNNAAFIDNNLPRYRNGGPFTFGNMPRVEGEFRMPAYLHEDFSLIKTFPIRESMTLQLKVEALNAFNRHAFALPGLSPNGETFGIPTGTLDAPRNLQLTGRFNF